MVDGICFDQLTRSRDAWSPGVVWTDSFLSSAVEAVMSLQDTSHAAQADSHTKYGDQVVPHHLSAPAKLPAYSQDLLYYGNSNSLGVPMWPRALSWYIPVSIRPAERLTGYPAGPVVVGELAMLIELVPFALPAPDGTPVDTTAVCDDSQG
jgi:hypothetical protein